MTFTFLCQNCLSASTGLTASDASSAAFEMGWALGNKKVSDPADPAAVLAFHNVGKLDSTQKEASVILIARCRI